MYSTLHGLGGVGRVVVLVVDVVEVDSSVVDVVVDGVVLPPHGGKPTVSKVNINQMLKKLSNRNTYHAKNMYKLLK